MVLHVSKLKIAVPSSLAPSLVTCLMCNDILMTGVCACVMAGECGTATTTSDSMLSLILIHFTLKSGKVLFQPPT